MDGIPLPGDREKSAASCLARHSARWEERYRILTAHLHYDVQDFTFLKTEGKKCSIDSKINAQSRPTSSTLVLFHSHLVLEAPQVLAVPVRQKHRRVTGAVKSYLWGTLMIPCQAIQSCEKLLPSCWPPHWDWSRDICLFALVLHGGGRRRSTSTCAMYTQEVRQRAHTMCAWLGAAPRAPRAWRDGGMVGCIPLGPTLPGSLLTGGPSRPLWPFAPLMPLGPGVRFWNENKTKTHKSMCVRGQHLSFQISDEPCITTGVLSEVAVPN